MMKWLLRLVAFLIALISVMFVIGWTLPVEHQATVTAELHAPPLRVFEVIGDPARYPEWRSGVTQVDLLDPSEGRPRFREHGEFGPIVFRIDEFTAPARMRTRIDDTDQPFGGTWTFVLEPAGTGTRITITEDGEVYNAIFRFLSRFVFSQTATIETYLDDLRRRVDGP